MSVLGYSELIKMIIKMSRACLFVRSAVKKTTQNFPPNSQPI